MRIGRKHKRQGCGRERDEWMDGSSREGDFSLKNMVFGEATRRIAWNYEVFSIDQLRGRRSSSGGRRSLRARQLHASRQPLLACCGETEQLL